MANEAQLRQRNLWDEDPIPLPKEIKAKVLELLIELLIGAVGESGGGPSDE